MNGAGDTERKALRGTTPAFVLRLPKPASAPASISVEFDPDSTFLDAPISVLLPVVRAPDAVDGIGAHRVTLTASGAGLAANRRGIAGTSFGSAFLITQDGAWFPITVASIRDDRIILADALPRGVEIDAGNSATVQYSTYAAALPAALTATLTGRTPIPWRASYSADMGADLLVHEDVRITGVLHVREKIFATGLDHHSFMEIARGFAGPDAVFGRQASWAPQIEAAHIHLVQWLRGAIEDLPEEREDSIDGGAFRMAHAHWTAALIEDDPDRRAEHKASAQQAAETGRRSIIRTDPDTGDVTVEDRGVRPSLLAGGSVTTRRTDRGDYYQGRPY